MSDQDRQGRDILASREHKLQFAVRKSVRYHTHRRNYYLTVESWLTFSTLVLGSAAAISALSRSGLEWIHWTAPAAIAVISAINLANRTSRKVALHSDLGNRFARLEKRFLEPEPLSTLRLDELERERLDIEMDEPATYQALNRTCHNEVLRSMGRAGELQPLRLRHRTLKNVWRFNYLPIAG